MFLISIHAPSRERLGERFGKLVVIEISIHDPSRERLWTITIRFDSGMYFNPRSLTGATARRFTRFNCRVLFQSTLPYGSDIVRQRNRHCIGISIHAPSRERPTCRKEVHQTMYFNPRSLTGATTISHFALVYCHDFNPRSLTGATAGMIDTAGRRVNFNPRSLTGATYGYNTVGAVTFISIPAPSRERLMPTELLVNVEDISIHAPSRERQYIGVRVDYDWTISIHAPSRERPISLPINLLSTIISIHAPSRERPR